MSIERVISLYGDYHWEGELRALNRLADGVTSGCVVAIGSYRGQADCALALHAHVPVYCIDPRNVPGTHYGDVDRPYWMRNVLELGVAEKVRPINLPSLQVAQFWTEPIGFLFVDGDHEQAAEDLTAWMPHVVDGGLVAMHDSNMASVILAVADRTDLVEIERSDRTRVYRKEPLYEPYTYADQTLLVRKGIGFADDKTTLPEVRTYDLGPNKVHTCIDVGANIGAFSAYLKSLWPDAQIVAVEPELSSYRCLWANISANEWLDILTVRSAVRYSHEDSVLYVNPNNSGCHKILLKSEVTPELEVTPLVATCSLELIMNQQEWASLDLLKIDAEGSEVDILMNCDEQLLRNRVKRIVGEFHTGYAKFWDGIGDRLRSLGFEVSANTDPLAHATFVAVNQAQKAWDEVEEMFHQDQAEVTKRLLEKRFADPQASPFGRGHGVPVQESEPEDDTLVLDDLPDAKTKRAVKKAKPKTRAKK